MATGNKSSSYRWVIEALLVLALASQAVTWFAPAALLNPIINDLHIRLGNAGLIISIISLCIAIFSLVGAVVAQKVGALRSFVLGLWLLAIGGVLSGIAQGFGFLLACRILEGIGFGVMIAPPATLVMQWFSAVEWPYVNMVNSVAPFLGLTATFAVSGRLFLVLGSRWQSVLLTYGIVVSVIACLWSALGRSHPDHSNAVALASDSGSLRQVLKMRDVRMVAAGFFSLLWVFQLYSAFLPEFFQTVRGMTLERAGSLTSLIPLSGVFAALATGVLTGALGLRRPFTFPALILFALGCLGSVTFVNLLTIRISLILIGVGLSAPSTILATILMELPRMTPVRAGSGLGVVYGAAYTGAFLSPVVGGMLAGRVGLGAAMVGSLPFALVAIAVFYVVPETGPGRGHTSSAEAVLTQS